jgi:S-adenosylmethionine/arginine decarboxylase-like enzyme
MLKHKHLIVSAKVKYPPKSAEYVENFISAIIGYMNMSIAKFKDSEGTKVKNPIAYYCNMNGNRGVTGVAILETSHCALHVWDEEYPAKLEFDIYSCSDFNPEDIIGILTAFFDPIEVQYKFLDREAGLKTLEEKGTLSE